MLLLSKFQVVGMNYTIYFFTGSSIIYCWFLRSYSATLKKIFSVNSLFWTFFLFNILVSLHQVLFMTEVYFDKIAVYNSIDVVIKLVWTILSLLLLCILLVLRITKKRIIPKVVITSLIITAVKFGLESIVQRMPVLIYRYNGIIDLLLVFIWFRIIFLLIEKDNQFELFGSKIFNVY